MRHDAPVKPVGSVWRRLARLVDLVALCEMLTHDGLPDAAASELVQLIRVTVDD